MKFTTDFTFTSWPHHAREGGEAPPPPPPPPPQPPSVWTPADLFATAVAGVWFDPSDTGSMFQDTAGTVPVTAAGQPVALMLDKSGNGNHLRQTTLERRPVYQTDGTLHWLAFDGVDDFMTVASLDLTGTDKVTIVAGLGMLTDRTALYLELSTNSNTNIGSFWSGRAASNSFNSYARGNASVSSSQVANSAAVFPPPSRNVVTNVHDIVGDLSLVRVDGAQSGATATGNKGLGNFGAWPFFVGMRAGATLPFEGNIHGLILTGSLLAAADLSDAETFLATRTGTAP